MTQLEIGLLRECLGDKAAMLSLVVLSNGAGGRTRTDMSLTSPDFESGAYTNFATPASRGFAVGDDKAYPRQGATSLMFCP